MKRFNIILAVGFSIAYAMLLSLGMACFLELLIFFLVAAMLDGGVVYEYPRFIPFCYFVGFIALMAIIALFIFNRKVSAKRNFTKMIWWGQMIAGFLLSTPMLFLWESLFDFLQKIF